MRRVLVTGATDGIGLATAQILAQHGWHVFVHGRSRASADKAVAAIAAAGGSAAPVWADFASMPAVLDLAAQLERATPVLDALVNNAGMYARRRETNADGFEMTMAVNHFAPFLLTAHVLPLVLAAPAARIVNVSSTTHHGARIDPAALDLARGWDAYAAYATSKLANVLFTRRLARDLSDTGVTVNALHPGVIGTKLLRAGFAMGGGAPRDGARTSVYLTESADVDGVSGEYFADCRIAKMSPLARDDALVDALWAATQRCLSRYLDPGSQRQPER